MYAIYENGLFISKYAATKYEARKFCVTKALSILKDKDENAEQLRDEVRTPLWFGEEPIASGWWLVYGVPGPETNVIQIVNFTSAWFAKKFTPCVEYTIDYREIERVNVGPPTIPQNEIVKSDVSGIKKYRDISDPRDSILFRIEEGVKLRHIDV